MSPLDNIETCPILIHQEALVSSFKELFKQRLSQNLSLSFDTLIQDCLYYAGIDQYDKNNLSPFKTWFTNVYELEYLKSFVASNDNQEIILSSNGIIQILGNKRKVFKLSCSNEEVENSLEVLALRKQEQWNYSRPFCSFYSAIFDIPVRITLVHYSCSATKCSKLFVRKHQQEVLPLKKFLSNQFEEKRFISFIKEKKNILITGSAGSGKTTFLKSLIHFIPKDEHLVCIEDTFEIYPQSDAHTSLLASDHSHKSLKSFCAYAMRMSPDRLVLGEIRSHEIVPFLLCLNSGHRGVMTTTHANSAREGIERLALLHAMYNSSSELKYQIILDLICRNIDFVVHMDNKAIKEVIEVYSSENGNIYYESLKSAQ